MSDSPFHAGTVAIVGRANAGKSSLLNAFLGETVSVASPVAQTTRRVARGILNEDGLQIVFLDTPGIRRATHTLGSLLNRTARGMVTGAEVALLVLDASQKPHDEDEGWMRKLATEESEIFAVLNKTDLGNRRAAFEKLWEDVVAQYRAKSASFEPPSIRWFEVSATERTGVDGLLAEIRARMPEAPPMFPLDLLTDDPGPFFIADVIRAEINARLKAELPHAIAVATDSVEEEDGVVQVQATIYVEKSSQRPIVIGARAKMIRDIRHAAEKSLREIYGVPHKVNLWVKVEPDWSRNYWMLKKFGYV